MPLDIEEFRKAGYQAIDRICALHENLEQRNVSSDVKPGYLSALLPDHAPEQGENFQDIADDYLKFIVPGLTFWQHPSFFAYFPTANTFEAMIGDLYASSASNPGFNWDCSPACTELEAIVMDWGAKLFGLDEVYYNAKGMGGGVLQTSASDSALTVIVAARSLYMREHPDVEMNQLIVYTTTQTHSLGAKATLVLGLKLRELEVRLEDAYALREATLRAALEDDIKEGLHPFVLVATVGTTSSGAIDNLREISAVAQQHPSLWVHVDAAWAGVALACPEFRTTCYLDDINRYVSSFCTNFHKWGLVNFDCSALWVRNRKHLTDALDITPEFLRTAHGENGTVTDYRNWHTGLGRRFRSLKLWFVLRSYGIQAFQAYIRKGIHMNKRFATLVASSNELVLVTPPSPFAISVFQVKAPTKTKQALQSQSQSQLQSMLTERLYEKLSSERKAEIALTKTKLDGRFCIRFATGAQRTEERHVERAFAVIQEEARSVLAEV